MDYPKTADTIIQYKNILNSIQTHDIENAPEVAAMIQRNHIEQERNNILIAAFAVSDTAPGVFEAMAIQMGFTHPGKGTTIPEAISDLAQAVTAE